uniref:ZT_dimer domain-containing protein n=1 Tax=Caenorhabditis tropicalis TaxID=1561998 RepID=A0A1I7TWC6_9PELO
MLYDVSSTLKNWQKQRKVSKFYRNQNALLEAHKEDMQTLTDEESNEAAEQERKTQVWDSRITTMTIALNVALIIAKSIVAWVSGSLAILASVVDSFMDITSGVVVWYACYRIERINKEHYPVGMKKLEPLTVVIVGMIMLFANFIVLERAVVQTIEDRLDPKVDLTTLIVLCTGTGIKFILFMICRVRKSAACLVLAIDQRNDCLTNMVALLGAWVGQKWWKYADPLGAFLVSGFIIITWFLTIREHIPYLIGRRADQEFINRITNISINHDQRIKALDTVHVYHFGEKFLVEVHAVFEEPATLQMAHDVAESLQVKLEKLPYVERAFVHCDYQFDGDEHV